MGESNKGMFEDCLFMLEKSISQALEADNGVDLFFPSAKYSSYIDALDYIHDQTTLFEKIVAQGWEQASGLPDGVGIIRINPKRLGFAVSRNQA